MCYNNSEKHLGGDKMSPEQTIIVAKCCKDYKKGSTFKYPAKYVSLYDSCKNCCNWRAGRCEQAQNILRTID